MPSFQQCCLHFSADSFYGSSASWGENGPTGTYLAYVTGRVKQMVESCEQGIETLAELPQAVSGPGYVLERNRIFQILWDFRAGGI